MRRVEVRHLASARALADLAGVQSDVTTCKNFLIELSKLPIGDSGAIVWTESLSIVFVVTYARAFASVGGGRRRWDEQAALDRLTPAELVTHKELLRFRSKHIAHSVSDEEQAIVFAELSDTNHGERVLGVDSWPSRAAAHNPLIGDAAAKTLAKVSLEVSRQFEMIRQRLFEEALTDCANLASRNSPSFCVPKRRNRTQ